MIEIEVEAGEAEEAAKEGTLNVQGLRRRIRQAEWATENPLLDPEDRLLIETDLKNDLLALDQVRDRALTDWPEQTELIKSLNI